MPAIVSSWLAIGTFPAFPTIAPRWGTQTLPEARRLINGTRLYLVRAGEVDALALSGAAGDAGRGASALEGDDADRGLRVVLHLRLTLGAAAPASEDEAASPIQHLIHLFYACGLVRVLLLECERALVEALLDVVQQLSHAARECVEGDGLLLASVAAHDDDVATRGVAGADLESQGYTL